MDLQTTSHEARIVSEKFRVRRGSLGGRMEAVCQDRSVDTWREFAVRTVAFSQTTKTTAYKHLNPSRGRSRSRSNSQSRMGDSS